MDAIPQAISAKTKKRVLFSAIIATLMIINTLIFSLLAIYKFSTDDTSSEGHQLISQYYMFTEWDPHHGNSCYFEDEEIVCEYYYPRGAFMLPQKDGDDNRNQDYDYDNQDQESGESSTTPRTNNTSQAPIPIGGIEESISNAVTLLRDQIKALRDGVDETMRSVVNVVNDIFTGFEDTIQDMEDAVLNQIDKLRKEYGGSTYDHCFPARAPTSLAAHAIDGARTCVNKTMQNTINNTDTVFEEIDSMLETVQNIPAKTVECEGSMECYAKLVWDTTVSIPSSIAGITTAVAGTTNELMSLQETILPCIARNGKFFEWATDSVWNITSCLQGASKRMN